MRRVALTGLALLAVAGGAAAQDRGRDQGPKLTCDRGPFGTRTYGATSWELYGCSDNRSIAIVTAKGNPGAPFYFLFVERDGEYQLSGEGTGLPAFTRRAYDDLRRLSDQDIKALLGETQGGPRAPR